jgi:hypothetical protein
MWRRIEGEALVSAGRSLIYFEDIDAAALGDNAQNQKQSGPNEGPDYGLRDSPYEHPFRPLGRLMRPCISGSDYLASVFLDDLVDIIFQHTAGDISGFLELVVG